MKALGFQPKSRAGRIEGHVLHHADASHWAPGKQRVRPRMPCHNTGGTGIMRRGNRSRRKSGRSSVESSRRRQGIELVDRSRGRRDGADRQIFGIAADPVRRRPRHESKSPDQPRQCGKIGVAPLLVDQCGLQDRPADAMLFAGGGYSLLASPAFSIRVRSRSPCPAWSSRWST